MSGKTGLARMLIGCRGEVIRCGCSGGRVMPGLSGTSWAGDRRDKGHSDNAV